jgi:hypothetical protein
MSHGQATTVQCTGVAVLGMPGTLTRPPQSVPVPRLQQFEAEIFVT